MVTMFSKRHYEAIAEVIRSVKQTHIALICPPEIVLEMRDELADLFEADNPRFDRAKFEEACER